MYDHLYLPDYDDVGEDEVYCCAYEEGAWAWRDIFYDLSTKRFRICTFEVCGCDLSGEKRTACVPISEEEALKLMDGPHKEYLQKRIKEYAGA